MKNLSFILIASLTLTSCASMVGSIGLGAGIGATTGIASGYVGNLNAKGMALTGAGGAAIGGLLGYLLRSKSKPEKVGDVAPFLAPGEEPILKGAEKDVIWVPGTIQNDKYVEPHRVWTIRSQSHWQHPEKETGEKQ